MIETWGKIVTEDKNLFVGNQQSLQDDNKTLFKAHCHPELEISDILF